MTEANTFRFVCNAWPEYKFTLPTRTLAFHHGVLDTDDWGAAFIRGHPLYNVRFFPSDPTAPVHGAIPEGAMHAIPNLPDPEIHYCNICDRMFDTDRGVKAHMQKMHKGG